eukprot:scaffold7135_cov95-Cylindrotheca_fusiformis.AAC.1
MDIVLDAIECDNMRISLGDFEVAVKSVESGAGSNDAVGRQVRSFKTSLYFSIDDPVAGSEVVRNQFVTWLSTLKASPALKGTPLTVTTLKGVNVEIAALPTDGHEFSKVIDWKVASKKAESTSRNVFICMNIKTHLKFSALKYSIL